MRGFLGLCAAVLISVSIGVAVEGFQPVVPVTTGAVTAPLVGLRVEPSAPCPASLAKAEAVVNRGVNGLDRTLLPKGAVFGLICSYSPGSSGQWPVRLLREAKVNGRTTQRFETLLAQLSTRRPTGIYACPAEFLAPIVLSFAFANGTSVDLLYSASGCQTVDNGVLTAYEVSGAPPFERFAALVEQLLGEPLPR